MKYFIAILLLSAPAFAADVAVRDDKVIFKYDEKKAENQKIKGATYTVINEYVAPTVLEKEAAGYAVNGNEYNCIVKGDAEGIKAILKDRMDKLKVLQYLDDNGIDNKVDIQNLQTEIDWLIQRLK